MKKDARAVKVRTKRELRALEQQLKSTPPLYILKKIIRLRTTLKILAWVR